MDRSEQLGLFTFVGFREHFRGYMVSNRAAMTDSLWWSDIRRMVSLNLAAHRMAPPKGSWWGRVASTMPAVGWYIDGETRTSPYNRARENRYTKSGIVRLQA